MTPPAGSKIILLMGQSNMVGLGSIDAANAMVADKSQRARVWIWSGGTWVNPASEPVHIGAGGTGVGPGLFFADILARANPTENYVLIPAAYGGTHMRDWTAGGGFLLRAFGLVGPAIRAGAGEVVGTLFYQGEADTLVEEDASSWRIRFSWMLEALQVNFWDKRVVYAQLYQNVINRPYWDMVKAQQAAVDLAGVRMIRTDDITSAMLPNGGPVVQADGAHLTTGALKVVGERMAAAFLT